MTNDEDRALLRGLIMGMRVTANANNFEGVLGPKEFEVLQRVAKGEIDLTATPSKFAEMFKGLPPEILKAYDDTAQPELQRTQVEDAQRILDMIGKPFPRDRT